MSFKLRSAPYPDLRQGRDGRGTRNQGPNGSRGPSACPHVQAEGGEGNPQAFNVPSKLLALAGRFARTLAPTRAPKTLAALLAAGGLVLAAPLLSANAKKVD
jgi:hypothetical protein